MTVRTTRVKSDTSPRHRDFYAPSGGDPTVPAVVALPLESPVEPASPEAEPDPTVGEEPVPEPSTDPVARPDARRALRAARRQRRRLTVVCALVVAVCLALTLLIVDLARTRTTGSGIVQPEVALVARTGPAPPAVPFLLTVDPP